jgi:hypothetical protein
LAREARGTLRLGEVASPEAGPAIRIFFQTYSREPFSVDRKSRYWCNDVNDIPDSTLLARSYEARFHSACLGYEYSRLRREFAALLAQSQAACRRASRLYRIELWKGILDAEPQGGDISP